MKPYRFKLRERYEHEDDEEVDIDGQRFYIVKKLPVIDDIGNQSPYFCRNEDCRMCKRAYEFLTTDQNQWRRKVQNCLSTYKRMKEKSNGMNYNESSKISFAVKKRTPGEMQQKKSKDTQKRDEINRKREIKRKKRELFILISYKLPLEGWNTT